MCGYREQLQAIGHSVPARWLNGTHQISDNGTPIGEHGELLVEGDDGSQSEWAAEMRAKFADDDLRDALGADLVVSFTEPPRSNSSRGGRHVEFGLALGKAMAGYSVRLIVVGHRENIFHCLPCVEFFATWGEALAAIKEGSHAHYDH